jgi:hypothetical protein
VHRCRPLESPFAPQPRPILRVEIVAVLGVLVVGVIVASTPSSAEHQQAMISSV